MSESSPSEEGQSTTPEAFLAQKPNFPIARKGYAQKDVDAYVSSLRDQLHGVREDLAKAQEEVTVAQDELTTTQSELADLKTKLDEATDTAEEAAAAIVEAAEKKATAEAEEAAAKAEEIIAAAEKAAEEIRETIRTEEEEMRERLRVRENEITAELDEIDSSVAERSQAIADIEQRLAAEEARYGERITTLQTVAQSLEAALKAVAEGSLVELGVFLETQRAAVVDNEIVDAAVHHHFTTDALLAASPPPEPERPKPDVPSPAESFGPEDTVANETPAERGSFYSRRSAGLPSIGEDQGQSILASMGNLRSDGDDEDEAHSA